MTGLTLIKLTGAGSFLFAFFPRAVTTFDRANWQPQETTIGTQPLFYANRQPREIRCDELWLDNTDTGASLTPTLKELRGLLAETDQGTPPPLLAAWGDRQERCALQDLEIEEQLFGSGGEPLRARVRLVLLQLQPERERANARIISDDNPTEDGPEP